MANAKKASGIAAVKAEKPAAKAAVKGTEKAAKAATAKPAKAAAEPVIAPAAQSATEVLKLKELVERVAAATSAKKPEAKALVEAVLAQMGSALFSGAELNLPHLGRLKTVKSVEKGEATQLTVKIKRAGVKSSENNSN